MKSMILNRCNNIKVENILAYNSKLRHRQLYICVYLQLKNDVVFQAHWKNEEMAGRRVPFSSYFPKTWLQIITWPH